MPSLTSASNFRANLFVRLSALFFALSILSATSVLAKKVKTPPPALPANGDVLIAGGVTSGGGATASAEFYSVAFKQFVVTGSMTSARATHQSDILFPTEESDGDTGKIFMIGGFSGSAASGGSSIAFNILTLDNFELYDPTVGTFAVPTTSLLQPMTNPRAFFTVIDLPADADHDHGHFLAIDGLCNADTLDPCRTSNVIHPDDHVTSTGDPIVGRMMHTATLLTNETSILVIGGFGDLAGTSLNSAEILDTNTDLFTATPAMNSARAGQTATILSDGRVFIAGGFDASGAAQDSAEIFDPATTTFTAIASPMHDRRAWHSATLLSDGRVLLTGGFNGSAKLALTGAASAVTGSWSESSGAVLNTAEIFDPSSSTFTCIHGSVKKTGACKKSMKSTRMDHTATLLADGDVLVAGGFGGKSGIQPTNSAELLHAGKFVKTGSMNAARAWHSAIAIELGL